MKNKRPSRATPIELRCERSLLFFNGQAIYRKAERGGTQYKFLSPAALSEAFRGAPVDVGWLPPGVTRAGATARGEFAALLVPSRRHELLVEGEKGGKASALPLWLPAFVFFGLGGSYYVWVVKSDTPAPDSMLYRAPLPNVFENAGVCWGQNKPPRASAKTITEAWALFITSPFNGHAASGKVRGVSGDVRPYLRKLSRSKKRFPAADLLPLSGRAVVTLDAAVSALISGGGE